MQKSTHLAHHTVLFCLVAGVFGCGSRVNLGGGDSAMDDGSVDAVVVPRELCGNGIDDNQNGQIDEGCPTGACAGQDVRITGGSGGNTCAAYFGIFWSGYECYGSSGCGCVGSDCDNPFASREACESHYAACRDGGVADASVAIDTAIDATPVREVCGNGIDDNGNGQIDEGCVAQTCDGQQARGIGDSTAILGYLWTGRSCVDISGTSCDGRDCGSLYTSEASCLADHQGCPLQPCGGATGTTCRTGYCFTNEGACSAAGTCTAFGPADCGDSRPYPVCGCNGVAYPSHCEPRHLGVSIQYLGDCTCPGGCDDNNNLTTDTCSQGQCTHTP